MLSHPSTIVPLEPDEFLAAHQYAGMVMENEFLEEIPGFAKSRIRTPDGSFRFRNDPCILFGFAARRYFRNEPDKFTAFMRRFFGLGPLLDHNEMKPYLRGAGDELEVNIAVLEVVATQELAQNYEFEAKPFFQKVREVAARMETEQANALKRPRDGDKR
jgi:hypothetical protein